MENQGKDTLSFIQLIKCILEYYGTTKKNEQKNILKEFSNELEEAESLIEDFNRYTNSLGDFDLNNMFVEVPNDLESEIKKTFISQLRSYQVKE